MRSKIVSSVFCVLILALALPSLAQTSAPQNSDEAALRAADARWLKAVTGYDLTHTLQAYTDDAIMMEPGAPAHVGIPALRETWHRLMNDNYFELRWSIAALEVRGDLAYTRGPYNVTFSIENRDIFDQVGKYLVIWKKMGNDWKVVTEIYNDDGPAKPHK